MIDEEVRAVVLAVIVISAALSASQAMTAGRVAEAFSAIGILGPEMKIGDHPKTVIVGEPFNLYVYIENQEGRTMYYTVLAKVGNNSTAVNETAPAGLEPFAAYRSILAHGQNATIPVEISLASPAQNAKLIFELWAIGENGAYYTGRWNHLWMNVTSLP
uniref:DUF1616 domain-containing protein n=1 Tax=Candidatus Methanomethylicus mesodigestus TaxID=1867258 RepID=A0A7C3EWY8_9CREN